MTILDLIYQNTFGQIAIVAVIFGAVGAMVSKNKLNGFVIGAIIGAVLCFLLGAYVISQFH